MSPQAAADARSLALPDWRGALSRVRRKRPDPLKTILLYAALVNLGMALHSIAEHLWVYAGASLLAGCLSWRAFHRPPRNWREALPYIVTLLVVASFVLIYGLVQLLTTFIS